VESDYGPAHTFSVWLEGASVGTARFQLLRDDGGASETGKSYRFTLTERAPQSLVVPLSAVSGDTINLYVYWYAGGSERHTKRLFVPIAHESGGGDGMAAPPRRYQSFGLPQSSLVAAARAVAARYGRPVTIETWTPWRM
jgi:hypothetical protein